MALFSPTFVLGVVVLLYLASFVVFAIVRIVTGLSIQRIGYFSLRRLAYVPRDGFTVEVRGLGIHIHRPTFSQPTWLSIVVSELVVTIDVGELGLGPADCDAPASADEADAADNNPGRKPRRKPNTRETTTPERSKTWVQLTKIKERIKRLHRNINWLCLVDVVATNSAVNVLGVGNAQIGSFTMAVDTRRKMVDLDRFLFQGRHDYANPETRQAEWIFALRSVLFTPEGREAMEIVDNVTLNIHGFLYEALDGLRDAATSLKLGRVHLPYDDLVYCAERYRALKTVKAAEAESDEAETETEPASTMSAIPEDPDTKTDGTRTDDDEDKLLQTVADSKEFVSSILRGIKEVQFAVSYLGITKKVATIKATGAPVLLMNVAMKEIGIDVHRLDPLSPAHRMYFSAKDIAHEALAAALSISVGVDEGHGKPQRLMYIPMVTTTVKTTLPARTVMVTKDITTEEKNANILFANSVVTSPSVDLDPRHLPLLLAVLRRPRPQTSTTTTPPHRGHMLLSRLLPKAIVKFSMTEPVVRFTLPPVGADADAGAGDYDLIISSISSISLDMEAFHSSVERLHYALASAVRVQTHHLFYQTSAGERFDLLTTESFDLKAQLHASPDVHVVASGHLQTFSVKLVRPEIIEGLHQIVRRLRPNVVPDKKRFAHHHARDRRVPASFLRALPSWLVHFHMQATDFGMEVAGVDERVSGETRGVAVQLESWSAEYRAQRLDGSKRKAGRRRTASRSILLPDAELLASLPSSKNSSDTDNDGRRIAIHGRGLEVFVVVSADKWEPDACVRVPRFEFALSTQHDSQGPVLHVHAHVRTLHAHYSLQRHYSTGVALMVLKQVFAHPSLDVTHVSDTDDAAATRDATLDGQRELVAVDVKIGLLQIKAQLPSDPPVMLQMHTLELGRRRWAPHVITWRLFRFHAEAPRMPRAWARVLAIKNGRVTCKEAQKTKKQSQKRSFDVTTEAIRLSIPHELVLYRIVDNLVNTLKSVQQLHHRFRTGTDEYILGKEPEGPKHVPPVSIRCRTFMFDLEDGGFEWKLGMIYRTGRVEQMQRIAREEAFRLKVKTLQEEEARRASSKFRARSVGRSVAPRGRRHGGAETTTETEARSQSEDRRPRVPNRFARSGRTPRYDPEGSSLGMTGNAHVTIAEARQRLNLHNARGWKQRIDRAYLMARNGIRDIRGMLWGDHPESDELNDTDEHVLGIPDRPALMSTVINDLHVLVDRPSFAMKDLPEFLYKVGKGIPKDMLYTLLVPIHLRVLMGEVRVSLRDYPLPLLHVPGLASSQTGSQKPHQHALVLSTDFVVAEEFQGPESVRHVRVDILPPTRTGPGATREGSFAIDVLRTTSQVKTYSDMHIDINTSLPTKITWGPSYQPAIQDMMMVIESFTKPQLDASESVGFWDKIRLSFHSRMRVAWTHDGNVHLALKGTRDPYQVTGSGAGFLMCWRNDVRWAINVHDDPKQFMTVDSGEYVLAVPDFGHHERDAQGQGDASADDVLRSGAAFKKVVMKLSGRVQWLAGLVFERALEHGRRSFDFEPHYNIVLKAPQHARPTPAGLPYDAFRGFRSQHIHMSIAVRAPVDRDWTVSNTEPSRSYNTVHLTPRFFTHFFNWWSLFGGPLSLPIRQGRLWPGCEKSSKKFGRHLATIKYNLFLAPLFLSHMYKHKDPDDADVNAIAATGIKVRFDSFMLDLQQRREEFNTRDKGRKTQSRTTGMKIHACQLDLASADIRAVSASIRGISPETQTQTQAADEGADVSRFTIPDDDFSWIDMDDFVELDWIIPTEPNPSTKILPLAYAPRVTYHRQTDIGGVISGDPDRTSPFGHEPTTLCTMALDDPRSVQQHLTATRLAQLDEQIENHARDIRALALHMTADSADNRAAVAAEIEALSREANALQERKAFLAALATQLADDAAIASRHKSRGHGTAPPVTKDKDRLAGQINTATEEFETNGAAETENDDTAAESREFTNRFVVHNMKLKWNNMLRNIILRYIHQVGQRRGFVYYLSRPAVKFILDIVEEQAKAGVTVADSTGVTTEADSLSGLSSSPSDVPSAAPSAAPPTPRPGKDIEDRIRKILQDGRRFVTDDEGAEAGRKDKDNRETVFSTPMEDLAGGIAAEFTPQNSYHVRLIGPQIQLQSDKNKKHVVLVTGKGMELKVVEVMDKARLSDTVSGLVQRRFLVGMDSVQFFVAQRTWFATRLLAAYAGSCYGSPKGASWPPWVPMEVMFDFRTDPFGFKRVVQKTSAMLRYDKFNNLRLKYTDGVNEVEVDGAADGGGGAASCEGGLESRMDNLWVEFPQARALCNSSQYYAIYVIVLDLLMYSEPLEKTRNERLEKIMLASDFSDLRGAPEMVVRLQERVRQLEDIKTHFQIHGHALDARGWQERVLLERDLAACEDELFFVMKAITTSQDRSDATTSASAALLKWSISAREIVWHLVRDNHEPLVELQLKDVEYDRTDNADGSHINLVQIGKILGLNLLPDAMYPEMIVPYLEERPASVHAGAETTTTTTTATTEPMVRVYWYMLEAIAGITVMDHFELTLFPMKLQLEHEVGKKVMEYIFPGDASNDADAEADEAESGDDGSLYGRPTRHNSVQSVHNSAQSTRFDTRAGSLELRLQPTLMSNQNQRENQQQQQQQMSQQKPSSVHSGDGHSFRFLRQPTLGMGKTLAKKASHDSLQTSGVPRVNRSSTVLSLHSDGGANKKSRFALRKDRDGKDGSKKDARASDDLTKMMARASSYKTFAYIRMPSVVLCLSYKGRGERNLEDVHDFVFRLPTIEYRNKTWSNLDLALALKGRIIKALISHTGAIIGNKLSKHRPNVAQQTRLRELATSSVMLSLSERERERERQIEESMFRPASHGSAYSNASQTEPAATAVPQLLPPTPQNQLVFSGAPPPSRGSTYGDYLRPVSRSSTQPFALGNAVTVTAAPEPDKKRSALSGVRNKLSALAGRHHHKTSDNAPAPEPEPEPLAGDATPRRRDTTRPATAYDSDADTDVPPSRSRTKTS